MTPSQVKKKVFPQRRKVASFLGCSGHLVSQFHPGIQWLFRLSRYLSFFTGLQVFPVLLDCGELCYLLYQRWEVCFSCSYMVLVGICFSRNCINQPLNIATAWSCTFHLRKQSQRKNKELNVLGIQVLCFMSSNLGGLLIFNPSMFGAGNLIIIIS